MSLEQAMILYLFLATAVWTGCSVGCWYLGQHFRNHRVKFVIFHVLLCAFFIALIPSGLMRFLHYAR